AIAPLLVMADQAAMAGEAAGNAYSKIFKSMMDSKGIAKALKDSGTGIQMNFTDGKGEFGGLDKMFKQLEKLKGLSTEARLPILS
ncbi:phage tail tape measure protein, partial [Acinetobacter baumannii]